MIPQAVPAQSPTPATLTAHGNTLASIIAGTTAVFSAVATGGAWLAARPANTTAEAVARIERERWHADLTPQFRVNIERVASDRAR
ncbi:hypothetical protein AB0O75_38130 [Streptomyces sp. NPDC088921]|uniref:hypothetical protein n=1 Tax=unclassified Streptomyces TaxID=2593676 RepID=UPI00342DB641